MDNIEKLKDLYLDPSIFAEELDSWEDIWDDSRNLWHNYYDIITKTVILPYPDVLNPVITTYFCMSAKWSRICPIMFCYGVAGSGKSTLANLAVALRGVGRAFSPNDTFASIRNELDHLKYFDPDEKTMLKDNTLMAWDNIYINTFDNDEKIYRTLLVGYDAKQSTIRIAGKNGTNLEFDVFCPKILSSVEPIHTDSRYSELQRRMLVIPHKRVSEMNLVESQNICDVSDLISLDNINWDNCWTKFATSWFDQSLCVSFVKWRKFLAGYQKSAAGKGKLSNIWDSLKWTISVDLMATFLAFRPECTPEDAINLMTQYWDIAASIVDAKSSLSEHIETFVEHDIGGFLKAYEMAKSQGIDMESPVLDASSLKRYLELQFAEGRLDIKPTVKAYSPVMAQLGWKLTRKGWTRTF